ncbi:hypothetical protein GPECTOR_1g483 [Gonium pectorale]|uniref:Mur ligase C-terminal domain-containing protein n=1 Tax=Gonium pectorale TaxID=33097 RepID=A0A150H3Y5_GONPE|nr:hypothetical protein GPECTOR_1g483 [Gonium pectorale]|eukprot:KXZ56538.1 hypothetical protein GPECTOR_1g483 [Gonium pectorale]
MTLDPSATVQAVRERLRLELLPEAGAGGGALDVTVGLVGPHQAANVATAVATARVLRAQGWQLPDEALARGLSEAALPGRFQVVKMPGPDGPWVVLDGAHTPDSAAALVAAMQAAFLARTPAPSSPTASVPGAAPPPSNAGRGPGSGPPVALLLAMAEDKEHRGVVAELRRLGPRVAVFTRVPIAGSYQRAAAPGTLAGHWQAAAMLAPPTQRPVRCRELLQASLGAAFDKALQELRALRVQRPAGPGAADPGPGVVLITGSLHAVAEAHKLPELGPLLRG